MTTFADLISRTITRLSMVPGYGVQTYAEDQIAEMLYHKFVTARDYAWWDDLMSYIDVTLDADGRPNENIVRTLPLVPAGDEIVINKYADIQHVWVPGQRDPLPSVPRRTNPASIGAYARFRMPDVAKVIRIVGGYRTGDTVTLRYKQYYPMFAAADDVPFDEQLLILGACWDYLEDDGTNPGQADKFKMLYTERMELLTSAENGDAISVGAL